MRTIMKLCAAAVMAGVVWLGQPTLQASIGCNVGYPSYENFFAYCGGGCDGYGSAAISECNNMGYGAMEAECNAWCVALPYPGWSGGILHNYYSEPGTGEDSASCQCVF